MSGRNPRLTMSSPVSHTSTTSYYTYYLLSTQLLTTKPSPLPLPLQKPLPPIQIRLPHLYHNLHPPVRPGRHRPRLHQALLPPQVDKSRRRALRRPVPPLHRLLRQLGRLERRQRQWPRGHQGGPQGRHHLSREAGCP